MGDVTIIRAPRGKEHPYFMHRRATAQDRALSFEARGVVAYLLSKPDDWTIALTDLMAEGGIGRDKARRILNELAEAGYLKQQQQHGDGGKFEAVVYVLHEEPQPVTENPSAVSPVTEKPLTAEPLTAEPSTVNPHHTYKEILQNTESLQITESTEDSSSSVVESPARDDPPTLGANDDDDGLLTRWVKSFNLFPDAAAIFWTLDALEAVGLMLEARRTARRGDGSGLLAQMLRTGTGRTADARRLAPLALELETLDWSEVITEEKRRDLCALADDVGDRLGAKVAPAPAGGEAGDDAPDGLDDPIGALGFTARDAWRHARGSFRVTVNQGSFTSCVEPTRAVRYRDGVLTLRAPHDLARRRIEDWRGMAERWLADVVGEPVQIEVTA